VTTLRATGRGERR